MTRAEMKQASLFDFYRIFICRLFFVFLFYRQHCYRCQGRLSLHETPVTRSRVFWWAERTDDRGFARPRGIQSHGSGPPWGITTRAASRKKNDWYARENRPTGAASSLWARADRFEWCKMRFLGILLTYFERTLFFTLFRNISPSLTLGDFAQWRVELNVPMEC